MIMVRSVKSCEQQSIFTRGVCKREVEDFLFLCFNIKVYVLLSCQDICQDKEYQLK